MLEDKNKREEKYMKSFEFTAKTAEKAIKEGLEQLGKKQEDVDIVILSEGGLFKKAKVLIKFDEEPIKTNFAKLEEKKEEPAKIEEKKEEVKEYVEPIIHEEKAEKQENEETTEPVAEQAKEVKEERVEETSQEKVAEKKAEQKKDRNAPKTQEEIEEAHRLFNERHFEDNSTSLEFVKGLVEAMKLEANVTLEEKRDASQITIEVEDAGKVIGHRGECLSAIQYLANIIENAHNPSAKRVVVDAGDYKQKREEALRALAIRVAGKVEATGRPYRMDPMNAFERRIVHTELHNLSSVETHSEGVEPFRRIIVTKKK